MRRLDIVSRAFSAQLFEQFSHAVIAQFKLEPHDKPVATGRL
jgi:hypothetical protein